MKLYRVKDWDKHFETHETRKYVHMAWIAVPVKMDGEGYTELLDHPNGTAHFGAWTAMVKLAATSRPRGTFSRNGGQPMELDAVARMTRVPIRIIEEAIPRLIKIGWLEVEDVAGQEVADNLPEKRDNLPEKRENPADVLPSPVLPSPVLPNPPIPPTGERAEDVLKPFEQDFEECWQEYPHRSGPNPRKAAYKAYVARRREGTSKDDLLTATKNYAAQLAADGKTGSEYVLMGSTFYGPNERWKEHLSLYAPSPAEATVQYNQTPVDSPEHWRGKGI